MFLVTPPNIHALFYGSLKVKLYKRSFFGTDVVKGGGY